jgi:hypothetical protein
VATNSTELDGRNSINPWPSDHRAVLTTFALTPPTPTNRASLPIPADGSTGVSLTPTLSWLPASNALSHTVYFGTNSTGPLQTNQTSTSFSPGSLLPATTYYWRVDEVTSGATVTGDVWTFTTIGGGASLYEWTFSRGDLSATTGNGVLMYADGDVTRNLTSFGITDGSAVPHVGGQPASYLRAPGFTATGNGYLASFENSGPNGGGIYINQFTLIFDLLIPGTMGWVPLFNTNPANANDADFHVTDTGAVGIGVIGFSAPGLITPNTWNRIAFAANLTAGTVVYYINGSPVFSGSATLDGRHSLYSNIDGGPDLLLFNEGNTAGVFTHEVLLSSYFFTDRTMSTTEIAALGGPKARGVAVAAAPVTLSISRQGSGVQLTWTSGRGPYQVLTTAALGNTWQDAGAPTLVSQAAFAPTNASAYYQVVSP